MKARIIIAVVVALVAASCETEVESRIRIGSPRSRPAAPPPPPPRLPPADSPLPGPEIAADGCHPSYDPCVPTGADVDCAGGGGNGPAYVRSPVRVIGPDEYDLDRDGDGLACDR